MECDKTCRAASVKCETGPLKVEVVGDPIRENRFACAYYVVSRQGFWVGQHHVAVVVGENANVNRCVCSRYFLESNTACTIVSVYPLEI